MARRRMFSQELISSDRFLGMAPSAQSFYFHMGMHADDEGFVSAPKSLGLLCGGTKQDLNELEEKGYIIRFDSGVLVIVDWMVNNTIRKERSLETMHRAEKAMLQLVDGRYVLRQTEIPAEEPAPLEEAFVAVDLSPKMSPKMSPKTDVLFYDESAPQNRIEENRVENNIIDNSRTDNCTGVTNVAPKDANVNRFADLSGYLVEDEMDPSTVKRYPSCRDIFDYCREADLRYVGVTSFWSYYVNKGWVDKKGNPVHDWKALARAWNEKAKQEFAKDTG